MNARSFAGGTRLYIAVGSNVVGLIIDPTRNVAYAMAFDRSLPQSLVAPVIAKPEHRCSRVVPPCE